MQAAVIDRYGSPDVVRIGEVPRPAPRAGEVLVRVRAVAVTSGDSRIRGARFPAGFGLLARLAFGVFRPRRTILGSAFSGEVTAVGERVHDVAPGDEVCGMTGAKLGAHAEYVAASAKKLARKPSTVSHEDAAGVLFGGSTALHFLRDKASVSPGMSVCVNGASGAIGTNAVQLAKHFGATVTGVTSTANADLVTDLGACQVIDYRKDELVEVADRFDVVLDAVGNLSITSGRRLLRPGGVLLLAVAGLGDTVRARGNAVAGPAPERAEDFDFLLRMAADGALRVVIDQVYDLRDIAAAHRRVDSGRKIGNIVVRM
ncbi:NAD(P)-dependent alcohol dehydrogenase [Streptomyces arboris]|uniref:NAD(P)-dependent alcohol dehydrogenase n=1 Tax=Streptomyces arboris TaxID=2600619 RepID=A0A5N5EG19_9ACTN|nr:NAD(P)-dependent alcohol dehydrogenase [Streptomyces arboris]KAB2589665.1 NAD(P)-dependent alcohol dehydrogenase [Streptomyces arboris]